MNGQTIEDLVWCEHWRCRLRESVCVDRHLQQVPVDGVDVWSECRECDVGGQRAREAGRTTVRPAPGGYWFTRQAREPVPADRRPRCKCGCGQPARESKGARPCKFAAPECCVAYWNQQYRGQKERRRKGQ